MQDVACTVMVFASALARPILRRVTHPSAAAYNLACVFANPSTMYIYLPCRELFPIDKGCNPPIPHISTV